MYVGGNPVTKSDPSGNDAGFGGKQPLFLSGAVNMEGIPIEYMSDPSWRAEWAKTGLTGVAGGFALGAGMGSLPTLASIATSAYVGVQNFLQSHPNIGKALNIADKLDRVISCAATEDAVGCGGLPGAQMPTVPTGKTVTLYRGTNNPELLQQAGGLRSGKFTLEELMNTDQSELIRRADPSAEMFISRVKAHEAVYSREQVQAWALAQSSMDTSPFLSMASTEESARNFGSHVIKANVPVEMTRDITKLSNPIYGFPESEMGEYEIAVIGTLLPEWIESVTSNPSYASFPKVWVNPSQ